MSGLCCRFMIKKNVLGHCQKRQDYIASPFFIASHLLTKHLHNNSDSVVPVKLAYASYESMQNNNEVPKEPIVIMHGLLGSKTNWNSLSKAIHHQTDRKVITIDARNHGDSPHTSELSYKHMARDVVQLLNDLGFDKVILLGHSMGGSTMMYVALQYPELVERLIVVDMSPVRTSPGLRDMESILRAMSNVTITESNTLTMARREAEKQLTEAVKNKGLRQFLTMNLVEASAGKFKWRVNLPVLQQNFAKEIAVFPRVRSEVYDGPTLFIGGGKSDYLRQDDHEKIKKLFPSAEFYYIKDAHHWVHVDKPAEFLKISINFINRTNV